MTSVRRIWTATGLAALLLAGWPAMAADERAGADRIEPELAEEWAEERAEARAVVRDARDTISTMMDEPEAAHLLSEARGVYVVPGFAKGALAVGGWGGTGIVLRNLGGIWSGPAFYDLAAVSAGAQIGFAAGRIAFLLMSDAAVDAFRSDTAFSLNANAGLTMVDFSALSQASWGKGDVIVWTDTAGAFIGADASVSAITWDEERNAAWYGERVTADEVLSGAVGDPAASPLRDALPG